jgi:hypothetical protein
VRHESAHWRRGSAAPRAGPLVDREFLALAPRHPAPEDAHRYRVDEVFSAGVANGVQIMATLRSLAMNALRLDGFWSITEGLAALSHDIRGLLELLRWREPAQQQGSGLLLMNPGIWASAPVKPRHWPERWAPAGPC